MQTGLHSSLGLLSEMDCCVDLIHNLGCVHIHTKGLHSSLGPPSVNITSTVSRIYSGVLLWPRTNCGCLRTLPRNYSGSRHCLKPIVIVRVLQLGTTMDATISA